LPDRPHCVVKQLKPQVSDPDSLQMARRLFDTEARVLYQLGNHDQIPRLLAHFEENEELYLAQELIEGDSLTKEIVKDRPWSESAVVALLQDILGVLAFVHEQNVIHRDIKPSNLIRRDRDRRIVLIDFGAVKQASTQSVSVKTGETHTISIGTKGYTPKEQLGGNPRFSSDIYAVGMLAIQALTGTHPKLLREDPVTGEINWHDRAPGVSPELRAMLDRMVRYDFRVRYATAAEALAALQSLPQAPSLPPSGVVTPAVSNPPTQVSEVSASSEASQEVSTNLWVPNATPAVSASQPSQRSGSSAPTVVAPSSTPHRFLKSWLALALLAIVGGGTWTAKTVFFSDRAAETAERPQASPAQSASPVSATPDEVLASPEAEPSPTEKGTENPDSPPQQPSNSTNPETEQAATPPTQPPAGTPQPSPPSETAKSTPTPTPSVAPPSPQPEGNAATHWQRCYDLNTQQRYAEAIAECDRALAIDPNYPKALWSKGFALDGQKRHQEALSLYERATQLKPDFAEAWSNRGGSLLVLGRPAEALNAYNKAVELKPDLAAAWRDRGAALSALGRYDEAVSSLEKALQLQPNDEYAVNLYMKAQLKRRR
jgi:serine/threonine protein kinase